MYPRSPATDLIPPQELPGPADRAEKPAGKGRSGGEITDLYIIHFLGGPDFQDYGALFCFQALPLMVVFAPGWEYPVYDFIDARLYTMPPLDDVREVAATTTTTTTAMTMTEMGAELGCTRTPLPPVKLESEEGEDRFIIELAGGEDAMEGLLPPSEVPLRATQASTEMRRMMGVFRLNPFAMHGAGAGGTWCGEVGPLEEEPLVFEFQLEGGGGEEVGGRGGGADGWATSSTATITMKNTTLTMNTREGVGDRVSRVRSPRWELEYFPMDDYLQTDTGASISPSLASTSTSTRRLSGAGRRLHEGEKVIVGWLVGMLNRDDGQHTILILIRMYGETATSMWRRRRLKTRQRRFRRRLHSPAITDTHLDAWQPLWGCSGWTWAGYTSGWDMG